MIRNKTAGCLLLALCWLALSAAAQAQELEKLPYVPTPQIIVDEMLKMAGVSANDFVVDLGSGDGRLIISAARSFKANGLGVDIEHVVRHPAVAQGRRASQRGIRGATDPHRRPRALHRHRVQGVVRDGPEAAGVAPAAARVRRAADRAAPGACPWWQAVSSIDFISRGHILPWTALHPNVQEQLCPRARRPLIRK